MSNLLRHTLAFILAIAFLGCTNGSNPIVTAQQENAIGARQERQILNSIRTIHSGQLYQAVKHVGSRIAQASGRSDFQWRYHLVANPKVANAFVLPGGKVFVFTGLFRYVANEDELAVVIAHEVAHALKSHGLIGAQRQQQAGLIGALLQVGMGVAGIDPNTAQAVNQVYRQGATIGYLRPHSRQNEMEADSIGLMLMAKAGYDPRASLTFWNKFGKLGQRVPEYLSTHPDPRNRIANIRRLMPQALALYKQGRSKYYIRRR